MNPEAPLYDRLGGRPALVNLLTRFYAACGEDPVVGPVFASAIADWEHHIDHVADFWSTQTGGPALYPGGMGRHVRLGLNLEHFSAWLVIWEKTCREVFPEREAEEMIRIAHLFAGRLKQMTGNSGVQIRPHLP